MFHISRSMWRKAMMASLVIAGLMVLAGIPALAHDAAPELAPPSSFVFESDYATPSVLEPTDDPSPTVNINEYSGGRNAGGSFNFFSKSASKTGKLFRGVHNVLFGWVEIPKTIMLDTAYVDPFTGFFTGLVHGTARTVERTGIGAVEVLTFWHEWPYEYQPIIMPEYVWGDMPD